ncbi:MAG: hypothetical protein ABI658_01660 [Acidimicrobiales bacterium]
MLRRVELTGDYAEVLQWLHENQWTDGLPVVPPTSELVDAMVAASGSVPPHCLGAMPPLWVDVTIEKLAVVAVMAGCAPAAFPTVIAATSAILAPEFRVASVQSSTSPATPLIVVNGAARAAAGVACGTGCLGPAAGSNVAIGRAVRLAMQLIGGGQPGDADPATLGSPAKISMCLGENEEASPWPSLASRRGITAPAGVVSAFPITGLWQISDPSATPDDVVHHVLHGMISPGHCALPLLPEPSEQVLLLSPPVAQLVATRFTDVAELQQALFETVRIPLEWIAPYKRAATLARLDELGIDLDDGIPLAERPECYVVVVAGGPAGVQSIGCSTSVLSRSVSVGVAPG